MDLQETVIPRAEKAAGPAIALPVALLAGLTAVLVFLAYFQPSIHHDIWHQMALARESIRLGYVPTEDRFAYTPTVNPSIQHEWGAGFVALAVASAAGAPGLAALNLLLAGFTVLICALHFRDARAGFPLPWLGALLAAGMVKYSFAWPVTAQSYSVVLTAVLLRALWQDRAGRRIWIAYWLPLFALWNNLHGGLVVGLAVTGAHTLEQAWRRKPWRHMVPVLAAMFALIAVNPYGLGYYRFLLYANSMPRPFIPEWNSMWLLPPATPLAVPYLLSLALFLYALGKAGPRSMPGFLIVALLAAGSAKTMKLVPFYALAWIFTVPEALGRTPLGRRVEALLYRRQQAVGMACAALTPLLLAGIWFTQPWALVVPGDATASRGGLAFPVGPVEYLEANGFKGNAMTFFRHGAYVSWKLHPDVKVGCDSRYEVAYPPALADENFRFYLHEVDAVYDRVMSAYPTDVLLVDRRFPLAAKLERQSAWRRVYVDDGFAVYARPGLDLPAVSRTGRRMLGTMP